MFACFDWIFFVTGLKVFERSLSRGLRACRSCSRGSLRNSQCRARFGGL